MNRNMTPEHTLAIVRAIRANTPQPGRPPYRRLECPSCQSFAQSVVDAKDQHNGRLTLTIRCDACDTTWTLDIG